MPQSTIDGKATSTPVNKVIAGAAAGAATTVLVFVLNSYVLEPRNLTQITGGVESAITVLLSFLVAWKTPPGVGEGTMP